VGLRRGIGAYIFGEGTGDPVADRIMDSLREKKLDGMSRTEIMHLFGRHRSAARIEVSLSALEKRGRVGSETRTTGGRPVERWFAK
jgi:predicted transcriptional regulator